jgi:hypothetical protein
MLSSKLDFIWRRNYYIRPKLTEVAQTCYIIICKGGADYETTYDCEEDSQRLEL